MDFGLGALPECLLHKKEILHICSCADCRIPNPFICAEPQCMKVHGHGLQQIIPVAKLEELLEKNTSSLKLLVKKVKGYYSELRSSISHEIEKIEEMMVQALEYKHTHPVITILKQRNYNLISPQKMVQLLSYLRGAKTERKSMEFIKNEVCESVDRIEEEKKKFFETVQFKKLMLENMIDANSTFEMDFESMNTSILDTQNEFKSILKMIESKIRKPPTALNLIYRASESEFSSSSYQMSIEDRGPLLMTFRTHTNNKFGCFLNCKVDKKEGWLTDGPGFSFIFSLDRDAIYPIKQEAKYRVKAMYVGGKGPQIGSGCDIYISDKCNENRESGSNFGGSFELPKGVNFGSKSAQELLGGAENFVVDEYEVFEVK